MSETMNNNLTEPSQNDTNKNATDTNNSNLHSTGRRKFVGKKSVETTKIVSHDEKGAITSEICV
jgi:hypothetical protein